MTNCTKNPNIISAQTPSKIPDVKVFDLFESLRAPQSLERPELRPNTSGVDGVNVGLVSSSVSAQVPADEACSNAIPRAQAVGVTLPFNLCINLP